MADVDLGTKLVDALAENARLRGRIAELDALINNPHTEDFLAAVRTEAAHQTERWGTQHDQGKGPTDWFWLLGYLGGKVVWSATHGDRQRALHHVITTAAACLNWHAQLSGVRDAMQPGHAPSRVLGAEEAGSDGRDAITADERAMYATDRALLDQARVRIAELECAITSTAESLENAAGNPMGDHSSERALRWAAERVRKVLAAPRAPLVASERCGLEPPPGTARFAGPCTLERGHGGVCRG